MGYTRIANRRWLSAAEINKRPKKGIKKIIELRIDARARAWQTRGNLGQLWY